MWRSQQVGIRRLFFAQMPALLVAALGHQLVRGPEFALAFRSPAQAHKHLPSHVVDAGVAGVELGGAIERCQRFWELALALIDPRQAKVRTGEGGISF